MRHNPESELSRIAGSYFSLLAKSFPIMCASDEFHFLPRVQEALQYLDRTDNFSHDAIADVLESVDLLRNFRPAAMSVAAALS